MHFKIGGIGASRAFQTVVMGPCCEIMCFFYDCVLLFVSCCVLHRVYCVYECVVECVYCSLMCIVVLYRPHLEKRPRSQY